MASAKSQPLHNFTLPRLKWNNDGNSGIYHQRHRSIKYPSRRPNTSSASPIRQSLLRDSFSETLRNQSPLYELSAPPSPSESPFRTDEWGKLSSTQGKSYAPFTVREYVRSSPIAADPIPLRRHHLTSESEACSKGKSDLIDYRTTQTENLKLDGTRKGLYSLNPEKGFQKVETKSKAKEVDAAGTKRSKKILIKIPLKSNKSEEENPQEERVKIESKDEVLEEGKIKNNTDEEMKMWNLRPRKPMRINGSCMLEMNKDQSNLRNKSNGQKKEKRKMSVFLSLSKEEIEEDIFSMTGSKPPRRPKKRVKNVQKQVDSLFPGSWLVSLSVDSYKVSENSLKG